MKSLSDAIRLRAQILGHLEEANSECNLADRRSALTFVVAGGGFAGVETVAALNDFVREALPILSQACVKNMLRVDTRAFWPCNSAWNSVKDLGRYTQKVLTQRGVEIRHRHPSQGHDG